MGLEHNKMNENEINLIVSGHIRQPVAQSKALILFYRIVCVLPANDDWSESSKMQLRYIKIKGNGPLPNATPQRGQNETVKID